MNKSNKLFEELLGDDASAFHNNNNNNNNNKKGKDDGESTQMSSILGPILRDKEHQNTNNKSSDNMPTPRSGKKIRNDVPSTNNNNNNNGLGNLYSPRRNSGSNNNQQLSHRNQHTPTTQNNSQQQKRRSSKEQHYEEDDEETLDTYMTKPRIIKFDSNSDDVSALFGGGGASQLGGVESYRGYVYYFCVFACLCSCVHIIYHVVCDQYIDYILLIAVHIFCVYIWLFLFSYFNI